MRQNRLEEIFAPAGTLGKVLAPDYEYRPEQSLLAEAVDRTLRAGGVLLAEAPTGVGKSLAYLIPGFLRALDRKEPFVVSTYTRTLQDQILEKEMPRVRRLIDRDLRVEVLKGRSNYLCRNRLDHFLGEVQGTLDGERLARGLIPWAETTDTGDLASAPPLDPRDLWMLPRIAGEPRFCSTSRCTPEGGCFYKLSRRRAREAHLIIVNHALLLVDLFDQGSGLPEWTVAVIDEAHHLPRAAVEPLSASVAEGTLDAEIKGLGGRGEPGATDLLRKVVKPLTDKTERDRFLSRLREIEDGTAALQKGARAFWEEVRGSLGSPADRLRYGPRTERHDPFPASTRAFCHAARAHLSSLDRISRELSGRTLSLLKGAEDPPALLEARQRGETLDALLGHLEDLITPTDLQTVYWFEPEGARGGALRSAPLDVGRHLRERLFSTRASLVLTSATLAVDGTLEHTARKVGLRPDAYDPLVLSTPFDLAKQVRAAVVTNQPDPRDPRYRADLARGIFELARRLRRKMLVLFTSHEMLRAVEADLRMPLADTGIRLHAQGVDGAQGSVRAAFLEPGPAVLLGAATFWEGMDFPGAELEVLVMARLPFLVPSDPVVEAITERLKEDGQDPFRTYYLPEAVVRFRQGFGRLIRRSSDRGLFVVADPRLKEQTYGARFRNAVGVNFEAHADWDHLAADAEAFFAGTAS